MFYLVAVGSMLAYSLQNALMLHFSRKMDGLSVATYRGLSFIVTMTPLFLAGSFDDGSAIMRYWPWLILSGLCGGIYLACAYNAQNFIPVGVAISVHRAFATITIIIVSSIFFGESLHSTELLLIAGILAGTISLGLQKNHHHYLQHSRLKGISLSAFGSLPYTVAIAIFAMVSRAENPWIAGYFWEVSIGIGGLILGALRWMITGKRLARVSRGDVLRLSLAASPTVIGTGLFGLAMKMGSISITSGIGNGTLVVTSLLAWFFYGERLRLWQWLSIGIVLGGIVGLRFV